MTKQFYNKEAIAKINETAKLEEVISDFVDLKPAGSALVGVCPHCQAKKFTVTVSKQVYKCFSGCGKSGKDALKFLQDVREMDFIAALNYLSDRYGIQVETKKEQKKKRGNRKAKFRDEQLKASGIPNKYQVFNFRKDATTEVQMDRYQAATIDKGWNTITGDDMLLHYLDLNGDIMTYLPKGSKVSRPLVRVRWAHPELHKNKAGKAIKYQSPLGSGSHLWLPNWIIKAYKQHTIIDTLYIAEGEKKADALCLAGCAAVGIMGIHNWSNSSSMPHQFEMLIKRCNIQKVVFLLDSDWQDLSIKQGKAIDSRPKTFFKAVYKFREYFYGFINEGVNLGIYFAHVKDRVYKGVDDLIVRKLKQDKIELKDDFAKALKSKEGGGDFVAAYDITEASSFQIKKYWHLHSTPKFLEANKEELKKLPSFVVGGLLRRWNEEEECFELAQKILPHEKFWKEERSEQGKSKYSFSYQGSLNFLANRGFGLYEYKPNSFRFVRMTKKVVEETQPINIRHFMRDFTHEIDEKNVLELILRGGKQYFGQDQLSNLPVRDLPFNRSDKDCMYFYFKNVFWKVTADKIEQRPLTELPKYVWKNQLVDFEPKLVDKMATLDRKNDQWTLDTSKEFEKSDIASFYFLTSNFHWQKSEELYTDDKGKKYYVKKQHPEKLTESDIQYSIGNLAAKMLAAGYVMHDYLDYSCMKAIVCMDGKESEVGKSEGGTGKSIWGKQFDNLMPMEIIDGQQKNLEDDNHLYEGVDERTRVIMFDDTRVNFNFQFLFSQITTGVKINPKGEKRYKVLPPKFIISTNHALKGEGNSHERRQYNISFSDFFNGNRTVGDYFGRQLFHEWDWEQWNLFYNWMATCVQHYLKFGLNYKIPNEMLKRRKLRQDMGENFLSFATLYFDQEEDANGDWKGVFLNKRMEKGYMLEKYLQQFPRDKRYIDTTVLKDKLRKYAAYTSLDYNAPKHGERIKSSGKEYFLLSDDKYNAQMYHPAVNDDRGLKAWHDRNGDLMPSQQPFVEEVDQKSG